MKAGRTRAGNQRYTCPQCQRRYTPEPKEAGYGENLRRQAVRMSSDDMNFRRIAHQLGVHHQTIINTHAATLPDQPPFPAEVTGVEQDELFTFIGSK